MDIEYAARMLRTPWPDWKGYCKSIAEGFVEERLVEGVVKWGYWVGPISETSGFYPRPWVEHAWIERTDGTVVDPTRWTLISETNPTVYEGPKDYYTETRPAGPEWRPMDR